MQEELAGKSVRKTLTTSSNVWLTSRAQKEKEELDDLSTELELADEDEKIQYVHSILASAPDGEG